MVFPRLHDLCPSPARYACRAVSRPLRPTRGWSPYYLWAACLVFCMGPHVGAQDKYTPEQLRVHFQNEIEAYQITLENDSEPLNLLKQPLLNWQNTERLQEQGALYMFHKDGRPEVFISVFTYELRGNVVCRHEHISLSNSPFVAEHKGAAVWTPMKAGLEWMQLDADGQPGSTPARRLQQMRGIARQYSGTITPLEPPISKLVFLPQPVVRYKSPKQGIIDGAVFAYAVVTDPEILLVLEARQSGDETHWHAAFARSHYWPLEIKRDGASVWKAEMQAAIAGTRAGQKPHSLQPYFSITPVEQVPPAEELAP